MSDDPELEKLNAMTARIKAEGKLSGKSQGSDAADGSKPLGMSNIGFDFLAAVLVCTGLGWLADNYFGSNPWGLLVGMVTGFAAGMTTVWRALNNRK
ncbi:MAG TPA: AtpZ/AtpI family protein [Alphaproteobacteria bacterium]|nr:AtpZ/AtpI family protein [Alphaproteobacteria bacterium]